MRTLAFLTLISLPGLTACRQRAALPVGVASVRRPVDDLSELFAVQLRVEAIAGNANAALELSEDHNASPQDAVFWMTLASNLGHPLGIYNLGMVRAEEGSLEELQVLALRLCQAAEASRNPEDMQLANYLMQEARNREFKRRRPTPTAPNPALQRTRFARR